MHRNFCKGTQEGGFSKGPTFVTETSLKNGIELAGISEMISMRRIYAFVDNSCFLIKYSFFSYQRNQPKISKTQNGGNRARADLAMRNFTFAFCNVSLVDAGSESRSRNDLTI